MQSGRKIDLTSIEFDILEVLMRNSGRVVTRIDLMNSLYQWEATATPAERLQVLQGAVDSISIIRAANTRHSIY